MGLEDAFYPFGDLQLHLGAFLHMGLEVGVRPVGSRFCEKPLIVFWSRALGLEAWEE